MKPSSAHVVSVVLALWNLAIAQPIYSVIEAHPPFLSAHRVLALDLVWVGLGLSLALPLFLSLPLLGLKRWFPQTAHWGLAVLCGLSAALVVAQALPSWGPWALAAICGGFALAAIAYARTAVTRRWLQLCAAGALVFPTLLVWQSGPSLASGDAWREHSPARAVPTPHPVVVVVFDEWPLVSVLSKPEALDRVRFPHLAEFADASVWYPNAATVGEQTAVAAPAILTGRPPVDMGGPGENAQGHPLDLDNLFTFLADGMAFNVFEGPSGRCPASLCADGSWISPTQRRLNVLADSLAIGLHRLVPSRWSGRLPVIDLAWSHFWRDSQVGADAPPKDRHLAKFDQFLERMADYPMETLHLIHTYIPHLPWTRLPSGQRYESQTYPHGLERQKWTGSDWEMSQAWKRHLLQVGLVDTLVGRLNARLAELGIDDEALVIITSDHGTSFRRGRLRRNVDSNNLTELLNVPLFVRYPLRPAAVDMRDASTLDILPTVLESLGIEPPPDLAGHSLIGPSRLPGVRRAYRVVSEARPVRPIFEYRTSDFDRASSIERARARFGSGDWSSVFALSIRPELLDRSPDALLGDEPPLELVVRQGKALNRFAPTADVLPIHLAGRLRDWPIEEGPSDLAIAVRGKIIATTQTYIDSRFGQSFTVLLDPARLTPGDNELKIYLVGGDGERPRLRATRVPRGRRSGRQEGRD